MTDSEATEPQEADITLSLRPMFGINWHYPVCAVSTLISKIAKVHAFMPWQVDLMRGAGWVVEVKEEPATRREKLKW